MNTILNFLSSISWWLWIIIVLVIIAIRDVFQKKHTISHNFPIVGHIRYWLESIGPEMRQYFVAITEKNYLLTLYLLDLQQ